MSALTGQGISPRKPQAVTATVKNDGWWPDIDMALLRESARLPAGVTDKRLVQRTRQVVLSVNNELSVWKAEQKAAGYTHVAEIPIMDSQGHQHNAANLYDEHPLITHYLSAVYAEVEARLNEQYRATDSTGRADKNAQMLDPRVVEGFRDKDWDVSAILNFNTAAHPRITVELI